MDRKEQEKIFVGTTDEAIAAARARNQPETFFEEAVQEKGLSEANRAFENDERGLTQRQKNELENQKALYAANVTQEEARKYCIENNCRVKWHDANNNVYEMVPATLDKEGNVMNDGDPEVNYYVNNKQVTKNSFTKSLGKVTQKSWSAIKTGDKCISRQVVNAVREATQLGR